MTTQEYDIFLCHNGADKPWVEELGSQIEAETIDGQEGTRPLRVFLDKWDIEYADNITVKINEALKTARFVACILSPEFAAAPWPAFEWTHIVATDPINARRRLLPILRRDLGLDGKTQLDAPAPFKALKYFDFRSEEKFASSFEELIRVVRGQPIPRGKGKTPIANRSLRAEPEESSSADPVRETILSNLLPVTLGPTILWSAATEARTPSEVRTQLKNSPPFTLYDKRIYTFHDLSQNPSAFELVVDRGSIEKHSVHEWLLDEARSRQLMHLLQRCLIEKLLKLGVWRDKKDRFFFRPEKGKDRSWKNPGDRPRDVAAIKTNKKTGESFWVHQAARIKFQFLRGEFFLLIDPSFVFTTDGSTLIDRKAAGKLALLWSGKQQNDAAVRNLLFWSKVIAADSPEGGGDNPKTEAEIQTGAKAIKVSILSALAKMSVGVAYDVIKFSALVNQVEKDDLAAAANDVDVVEQEDDDELEDDEEDEASD